ncbi:MAG TPA: FtsL-like putative cell division protein [Bacteroidales bacterium]|nr:FtsL-like putative cell division protein [Bacteroidales bacterium]
MENDQRTKKQRKSGSRKGSYRVFLNELLDGSFMTKDVMRRNALLLLLLVGLIIVYISNHYAVIMRLSEIDSLQKELTEAKYEALTRTSDLMRESRQSFVQEMIIQKGLELENSTIPPFTIAKDIEDK